MFSTSDISLTAENANSGCEFGDRNVQVGFDLVSRYTVEISRRVSCFQQWIFPFLILYQMAQNPSTISRARR